MGALKTYPLVRDGRVKWRIVSVSACRGPSGPTLLAPDYLLPTLDAEVLSYFAPEADEYLQTIESLLHRLRDDSKDGEAIYTLYRTAHMLKESAFTIGFTVVCDVAQSVEDCMIAVREGRIFLSSDGLGVIGRAVEVTTAADAPRRRHDRPTPA